MIQRYRVRNHLHKSELIAMIQALASRSDRPSLKWEKVSQLLRFATIPLEF
jgi:hypothetical protein